MIIPGLINSHYHSHDVLLRGAFEQMPLDIWSLYTNPGGFPRRADDEVRLRTLLGAIDALCNGITTMQDMVTVVGADHGHADAILSGYRESGARAVVGLQLANVATVDAVAFWRDLPEHVRRALPGAADATAIQSLVEALVGQRRS